MARISGIWVNYYGKTSIIGCFTLCWHFQACNPNIQQGLNEHVFVYVTQVRQKIRPVLWSSLAHISSIYCNADSLFHDFHLSSKAHAREVHAHKEHAHNLENELWSLYQLILNIKKEKLWKCQEMVLYSHTCVDGKNIALLQAISVAFRCIHQTLSHSRLSVLLKITPSETHSYWKRQVAQGCWLAFRNMLLHRLQRLNVSINW
jgi:hypothetical protein